MGDPYSGRIYEVEEGQRPERGHVPLNLEEAERLRGLEVEARKANEFRLANERDIPQMQAVAGTTWRDIAASAYRAYSASTDNKNFRGEEMPQFEDLPAAIQTAWEAAVRQAGDVQNGGSYGLDTEQRWKGWIPPHLKDSPD